MTLSNASADLTYHNLDESEAAAVRYITPPSDDEQDVHIMYIMPPSTERSISHVLTRCAFTANAAMMFSSRVKYEFVNVDAPHSVPSAE